MTELDLLDPARHASGEIMVRFRELRERSPVVWTRGRRGNGYWSVLGYPELAAAARDPGTFSSHWGTRPEVLRPDAARRPLHNQDPPAHGALRTLAAHATTADHLNALPIANLAAEVIERFARSGGGDAVRELAVPLAIRVFAAWLGIAPASAATLYAHVVGVHAAGAALLDVSRGDPDRGSRADAARHASTAIATTMAATLAAAPAGSLLRDLVARAGDEALGLALLFVEAGLPTVVDALASSLADLVAHPDVTVIDAVVVEELLRRASPIAQFARRATAAAQLGEATIAAGEQVVLWFVSANHDERVFADPERFDPARKPNAHLAFGVGPHHCLGASLARRTLRAACDAFVRHRFELAEPGTRRASSYLRGYERLPLRAG